MHTDAMEALLSRWSDHIHDRCGMRRPQWFDSAGELALAERVTWFGTAELGSWQHDHLPSGPTRCPVCAGLYWHREGEGSPVARMSMVVLPLAEPARVAAADWAAPRR
ncbi:hypothetical protein [Streptomyces sp. KMM 9044]|uniref:hypothetical protein n=1 Tax=Streptomyces sp. KMM 9044 TaxID=2744474 RepID=UPI0021511CC5|nr:hypothetical protein [Streptomyces sp. KMM 9044]WAX81638.1 hypothetical protein HUV60_032510 [Streptomyces sp. KMM 9044]